MLIALAVDGMLVAATLAIVSQRRHRRPAGWVPWLGLTLGILASLAANVAAARPELIAQLIAAWPPVALAVSIETLVVVLRSDTGSPGRRRPDTETLAGALAPGVSQSSEGTTQPGEAQTAPHMRRPGRTVSVMAGSTGPDAAQGHTAPTRPIAAQTPEPDLGTAEARPGADPGQRQGGSHLLPAEAQLSQVGAISGVNGSADTDRPDQGPRRELVGSVTSGWTAGDVDVNSGDAGPAELISQDLGRPDRLDHWHGQPVGPGVSEPAGNGNKPDVNDPVADLIESGAGRRRIAAELGVTEYRARKLQEASKNGGGR